MPAFRFIGDPRHGGEGPDAITLFGLTFGRAGATEVADAAVVRKLADAVLEAFEALRGLPLHDDDLPTPRPAQKAKKATKRVVRAKAAPTSA